MCVSANSATSSVARGRSRPGPAWQAKQLRPFCMMPSRRLGSRTTCVLSFAIRLPLASTTM